MAGRVLLERAFAAAGTPLSIAAEASTAETLRALAEAGMGPAFLPSVGPIRRSRRAGGRAHAGTIELDVTALVPAERVRYGLLTLKGAPMPSHVIELKKLIARGVTAPAPAD